MSQKALILGSNGRFGRNAAIAFKHAGWQVHRFDRQTGNLRDAVQNADVVVNGWNPPDYTTWHTDLLPIHRAVIDALQGTDKTVIVPGNVYVFGPQTAQPWSDDSPHNTINPLGLLRKQMEDEYLQSGIRTILLRAGDFLDTEASGNWFDKIMVTGLAKGRFTYPGAVDVAHAWAFLPDLARAAVALAERRTDLPQFCDVPFAGYTLTGGEMGTALKGATGRKLRTKSLNRLPLRLLQP